jgi:hypothetical protein
VVVELHGRGEFGWLEGRAGGRRRRRREWKRRTTTTISTAKCRPRVEEEEERGK